PREETSEMESLPTTRPFQRLKHAFEGTWAKTDLGFQWILVSTDHEEPIPWQTLYNTIWSSKELSIQQLQHISQELMGQFRASIVFWWDAHKVVQRSYTQVATINTTSSLGLSDLIPPHNWSITLLVGVATMPNICWSYHQKQPSGSQELRQSSRI
ncbi:hypothetical protein K7432_016756, partial [Basidiobolus ranarum]